MVANHGSLLDPPLLGHALGCNISFMAVELFKYLYWLLQVCGAYPVRGELLIKIPLKQHVKLSENTLLEFLLMVLVKNGRVNKPKQRTALLAFKNQKLLSCCDS